VSKRTALVAYERSVRQRRIELHWHRGPGGSLVASAIGLRRSPSPEGLSYRIERRSPDRRHGILPVTVCLPDGALLSLVGYDTVSEAKKRAQAHANLARSGEPPSRSCETPEVTGGGTASYRDAVRQALLRMGSPDASKDVIEGRVYVERCEAGKIAPDMCAAMLMGLRHHGHPHDCPGHHVTLSEAPNPERYHYAIWGQSPGYGYVSGWAFGATPEAAAASAIADARTFGGAGKWKPPAKLYLQQENGEHLAMRIDADGQVTRVWLKTQTSQAPEARDSAPDGDGGCAPFTRLVRDPAALSACMKRAGRKPLSNSRALYDLVAPDLVRSDQERFMLVCVGFRGELRDYAEIALGQRHRVAVDLEDVLRPVLISGCDGFAVVHNHPSGKSDPSDADCDLTEQIRAAAKVACPNVRFLDHVVIGVGQYYSFTDEPPRKVGSGWEIGKSVRVR